jgi:hypothetical protein
VQGIGERVVDRLDLAVGEDVGVGAERSLYPVPSGKVLDTTAIPGRDGDKTMASDAGGHDDGELRDPCGTKHADADRGRGRLTGHKPAPAFGHVEMNSTLHDRIRQVNKFMSIKKPSF